MITEFLGNFGNFTSTLFDSHCCISCIIYAVLFSDKTDRPTRINNEYPGSAVGLYSNGMYIF